MSDKDKVEKKVICANKTCKHFDPKAEQTVAYYCSLRCKYDDPDFKEHNVYAD